MSSLRHPALEVPDQFRKTAEGAVVHSLGHGLSDGDCPLKIGVQREVDHLRCDVSWGDYHRVWRDDDIGASHYGFRDWRRREKELLRRSILEALEAVYGLARKPWGILTGVRPTKMVHNMWDRGFSLQYMDVLLRDVYRVQTDRRQMVLATAARQRPFFPHNPNGSVGVYIGIPFCPSRCGYCSFAAYPLATHGHLLDPFFESLCREIEAVGNLLCRHDIGVDSVYLGGGTPTILEGNRLRRLLKLLHHWFQPSDCRDFTVEAGRPETLHDDTLGQLREAGVHRVSINPQTMVEATLKRIGRAHTPFEIEDAFRRAREHGIPLINMDVILGLPGETLADVEYTLGSVKDLGPDHLTVHALARKRAAVWNQMDHSAYGTGGGHAMAEAASRTASAMGLVPYYLYRQRHIVDGLENVGYARPGTESLYNMMMMEERQTIFGIGSGAVTKFVAPDGTVRRTANPKCPATYARDWRVLLERKQRQFSTLLAGV